MSSIRIAIDAMGGDKGALASVQAASQAIDLFNDLEIVLVGDQQVINQHLNKTDSSRLSIQHTTEVVSMEDSPTQALRYKKNSSMRLAIDLVAQNLVDGCLSAGNTGALMATAKMVLKTLPHIDRPAICTAIPNQYGDVYALDLGANTEVNASQLVQFAIMGSAVAQSVGDIENPKIGLLNIGSEEIKGSPIVKQAHKTLKQITKNHSLNYLGYIEADDIFLKNVDVVSMGGAEGNIALKASEGAVKLAANILQKRAKSTQLNRLLALLAYPVYKPVIDLLNPSKHNGACLIGLKKIVVKSHGNADTIGFLNAIRVTRKLITNDTVNNINAILTENATILDSIGS